MFEQRVDMPNHAQWPINTLENLCEVISRGKGPRYVEASTVNAIGQRCITDQGFDPSLSRPHDDKVMSGHLIPAGGDVLLNSTGTGTIGRSSVFDGHGKFIVDSHVTLLRPLNKQVDSGWLNELLRNPRFQRHLEANCYTGSTNQLELSRSQLMKASVPTPSHDEQHLIARILDTLDTQIQKTEALIAKMEKVKEGLLHDLLTRGIDEDGRLRPSPEQAPELYKESPLGLIPRGWSVSTLGQRLSQHGGLIQTGPFGSQLHAEEYVSEGIPVVMPQDMRDIDVSRENIAQITEERAKDLSRHRVAESDLLFSRRGDLSRCSFMSTSNKGWLCGTGCLLLRPADSMNGYWLASIYKQPSIQSQVYGMAVGSTMVNLNSSILANIVIPIPALHEQNLVVEAIRSSKRKILDEKKSLNKMKVKKSGLMDDLLTGRVRVTPLLEQAQEAIPA